MTLTILADDHKLFSDGLKHLLEESQHFKVVKQFTRGNDLLEHIEELNADLLLLDISIPGANGLDILKRIRLKDKNLKIVMLSMHEETIYLREAYLAGADAYLTKSLDSSLLIRHLLHIIQGNKIFPVINFSTIKTESRLLSKQEIRILRLIADGKTNDQIATELSISCLTVKSHRRNMIKKLKAESSAELVSIGFNKGIL